MPIPFVSARWLSLFALFASVCYALGADEPKKSFDIPSDQAARSLKAFAQQAGVEVMIPADLGRNTRTPPVKGDMTTREAISTLLADTGLVVDHDAETGVYVVRKETEAEAKNGSSRPASNRVAADTRDRRDGVQVLPKFEVMGTKLLNMDIRRTRDDARPYVIFERDTIANSGATSLEDFLKQRLTANTTGTNFSQTANTRPNSSSVNLRGLGSSQTLILVDGQRLADDGYNTGPEQADINGIPLGAIERIEVLPTAASGIYGGRATGGAINIILRRDYQGVEVKGSFEDTFNSSSPTHRVDLAAGFTSKNGKTNVLISANYADIATMLVGDRPFYEEGLARVQANNPAAYLPTNLPQGGTLNIRSANGSPLFGAGTASFTSVPVGYTGGGGLAPLQTNAGKYNLSAPRTTLKSGLWNGSTVESMIASMRHQFSPKLQVIGEVALSRNQGESPFTREAGTITVAATAPSNPFGQAVLVRTSDGIDSVLALDNQKRRLRLGAIVSLPAEWQAQTNYLWSSAWNTNASAHSISLAAVQAAVNAGTLDLFRDPGVSPIDFTPYEGSYTIVSKLSTSSQNFSVLAAGPFGSLPAGRPTLNLKLEYRDEQFEPGSQRASDGSSLTLFPERSQTTQTAYGEIRLPVFSHAGPKGKSNTLELEVAGRVDRFSVDAAGNRSSETAPIVRTKSTQEAFNPTVALRYQPLTDLTFRVSYGTGFVAPSVVQLVPGAPFYAANTLIDPRRGNEANSASVAFVSGGNASLRPEESTSWSGGIIFTPRQVPGLRLSVDYTQIDKTDNITTLTRQQIVDNEAIFPDRVVRGPVPTGDPYGVGPITSVDITSVNIARAEVTAYDVQLDYERATSRAGKFGFYGYATWQPHYLTQLLPGLAFIENAGVTSSNPLRFKANAGLRWKRGRLSAGWNARYFDSYVVSTNATVLLNQGARMVPSQIYHDLTLGYRFEGASSGSALSRAMAWTEIQFAVKNVFNTHPPFDAGNAYYYSGFADPRLATYVLSLKRSF
jgi:iron complex outermembrane recepter protein